MSRTSKPGLHSKRLQAGWDVLALESATAGLSECSTTIDEDVEEENGNFDSSSIFSSSKGSKLIRDGKDGIYSSP